MASHSYKTILKKIILKLGFGFKKNRIEACLGEEIPLQLDEKLFEGNVKSNKTKNRKNSFARWSKEEIPEITDSKTVQDDQGNTNTRTSLDGTLNFITANNSADPDSSATHAIEAKGGRPIRRYLIPEKQLVDSYISNKDYSYNVFLNNLESAEVGRDCFKILRNGVIIGGNQTRFAARLAKTPNFAPNTWFGIGSNLPFQTIFDIDGTNTSAGLFYPGDGNGNEAYYITKYTNVEYLIGCQFTLDTTLDKRIRYDFRTVYTRADNTVIAEFPLNGFLTSFQSVNQIVRLTKESVVPDGRIKIRVNIHDGKPYINTLSPQPTVFENYFGVQILL